MIIREQIRRSDMIKCLLCEDAPCSAACPSMDPAGLLRSVWFDNADVAALSMPATSPCEGCSAPCEASCIAKEKVAVR
ncbi:MAG: hypothetical protein II496_06375, partial [Clostridiales bacterium]|nr:hypothetical protein [Clostridiales bacterium]